MLKLSPLSIIRNEFQEVQLTEKARAWIDAGNADRLSGIHASDLLDPRLAYWKTIVPKPLTERSIWLFVIGKILHHFVIDVHVPGEVNSDTTDTGANESNGILFSPDLEDDDGHPIELKTTRSSSEPTDETIRRTYHNYLEQLVIYMVLRNTTRGYLWVLYINLKSRTSQTFPEPRCYEVTMSTEEFLNLEQRIFNTRDLLTTAIDTKNPGILPLCRTWLCGDSCPWWRECAPAERIDTPRRSWTDIPI